MKERVAPDNPLETPCGQISRREGLKLSAASIMASLLPVSAVAATRSTTQKEDTMPQASATQQGRKQATDQNAIRPFHVNAPETELTDLRRRIHATKWPERETVTDASQGVQLATTQKLARHWTEYDWRKCETKLNALPQFITEIDGLDIHFIHVRSKHGKALPVIVTHGWPGSIIEQLKIIG